MESGPRIRVVMAGDDAEVDRTIRELLEAGTAVIGLERDGAPLPQRPARRLLVRLPGDKLLFLRSGEIDWIEAANQYVRVRAGARSYLMRESMNGLERRLDPRRFRRIHRSTIVNLERVRMLRNEPPKGRWAVLEDGSRLEVGRNRWHALCQALLNLE